MTKIIAVDMDETLVETLDAVLAYNKYQIKGLSIVRSQVTNYQLRTIPHYQSQGIVMDDCMPYFDNCMKSEGYADCPAVQGSREKIQERKSLGYTLKILTGRAEWSKGFTTAWVEKNYPGCFDEIIFANYFTAEAKSKGEICQERGISIMIEDSLAYAENTAQYGITTYLLDKPWNQDYHNTNPKIIKVSGRSEITIEK